MTREEQIRNLQVPDHIIDMVLDTDTYNEIDDQFAISFMLRSPERINVLGFTAAPYFNAKSTGPADGMEKSYDEIIKLLKLAGREELIARTYRGSKEYLPDEKTPVDSPAAHFLSGAQPPTASPFMTRWMSGPSAFPWKACTPSPAAGPPGTACASAA